MTQKMSSRTSRSVAVVSLLGAVLIGGLMAAPVRAQANNPLDVLLVMVTALRTSVNALQTSVNLLIPPTETNVRITPPVLSTSDDTVRCTLFNASNSNRTIRRQIFGGDEEYDNTMIDVPPGFLSTVSLRGFALTYCKLTVINGTRADIRGTLQVSVIGGVEPGIAVVAE